MDAKAIEMTDVEFAYGRASDTVVRIKRWSVAKGDQVFVYGPSGSGKSTLLSLLGGTLLPQRGQIHILGTHANALSARQRDRFRARHVGTVFQRFNLLPYLSVMDNIRVAAQFAGSSDNIPEQAAVLMRRLGLPDKLLLRKSGTLSVGQQQRVAIARALINKPPILVADEPTSALDSDNRDHFLNLLLELASINKTTLIFVSHDQSFRAHFSHSLDWTSLNAI